MSMTICILLFCELIHSLLYSDTFDLIAAIFHESNMKSRIQDRDTE